MLKTIAIYAASVLTIAFLINFKTPNAHAAGLRVSFNATSPIVAEHHPAGNQA